MLIPGQDKSSIPQEIFDDLHEQVAVNGEIVTRGGTPFLAVKSWKRL